MRLTKFEISGHAHLKPMTVEVREHLVIVGANDVGKTSILRLLNHVLGSSVQQLYQGLSVADVDPDAEALVVKIRFEDFVDDEDGKFPFEMTIEEGEPDYLLLTMEVRISANDPENVTIERYFPDSGTRRSPSRDQLATIGWRYMRANRVDSTDYMDGRNSPFRAMLNSADIGDAITDLGGLLDQFNDKLESNSALTELRRSIASHLSRSIPKSYDENSLAIRTAADPKEQPLQDVTLFLRDGDGLKGLTEQSDGMRQLMALTFFDLAQATANIVAVDEPEMHLHASSQRTVASIFAESPKQRLLVTHSPYVVQRFEPKHVLVISPQSVATQIDAVNFNAVEKERLQWWSPQLLEGLTARRMLFVEGLADRIVVEAAAQVAGDSLDRLGVSVFALDGADKFSHVLKIIGKNGFDLSICGLCDEDREEAWSGNLCIKLEELADNGFFIARKDLEHEYARAIGGPELARELIAGGVAREQGFLQASGAASLDDLTDDMVADFITKKDDRKVPASRVVASILSADHIDQSPSLSGLIQFILQGD